MMEIYCCKCETKIDALLTDGREIYPHRSDLHSLPFWKCPTCGNHVGCHHKTKNRTQPLGSIPSPELKRARQHIHAILDPLWKSGRFKRYELYRLISDKTGRRYHTAQIRTLEEAEKVRQIIKEIAQSSIQEKE